MRRLRRSRAALIVSVLAVVVLGAVVVGVTATLLKSSGAFVVAAWLPTWDERASSSLPEALDEGGVREVGPTWATVRPDGSLTLSPPPDDVLEQVTAAGADLVPVVQNFSDGRWQGEETADLLGDDASADEHRRAIVSTAVRLGWDGVDVDYEELPADAGPAFVEFLTALRDDLHDEDLVLAVSVPARDADEDTAYDYAEIGAVADQVRVMAYDHAWGGSPPGPVAPAGWVADVVAYAVEQIPPEKLMLGIATYGYDWADGEGTPLGAADAVALAEREGVDPRWDEDAAASTFRYEDDGTRHTVWYEDARSLRVKQQIAVDAGLRGVALWRMGGEDPRTWELVGDDRAGGAG
jgi:spore germination protein